MNPIARRMFSPRPADAETAIRIGVAVMIRDARGRLLLEKRSDCGLWGVPGGRVEPGESVTEAAVREVEEETGLSVRVTGLLGVYSEPEGRIVTFPDNGDVRHLVDVTVKAEIRSGSLRVSAESEALAFFHADQLPPDMVPPARGPIEDYLNNRRGVLR